MAASRIRNFIVRNVLARGIGPLYRLFETVGLHVTPVHFYSPIPRTGDLTDDLFRRVSECPGVNWNADVQTAYLDEVFPKHAGEVEFTKNSGLSLADAAVLHAMIRHHKPKKMIEIGSGFSTRIAARACTMNAEDGYPCELTAIEPYPAAFLRDGLPGLSRLIPERVQDVDLAEFADCDLLFVDSSHVVRIGGDVNREILDIVPRLKPGAIVHWHDILLPCEYWADWVKGSRLFWSEQYLLQAFLAFNHEFEILWAARYMHVNHAERVRAALPMFEPERHRITSFWVRRKP
ncbi:MAG: class I SAM-dependent methyltransferase [Planctomycetes bacterium]|nr:class I SAM-dependent methyltransferase [Planctomycetota bacterium]